MIVLIDNYDSFTFNLVHYLGELGAELEVRRNDQISVAEVLEMDPESVVLSPGPCTPDEAGISVDLIKAAAGKVPLLGVFLDVGTRGGVPAPPPTVPAHEVVVNTPLALREQDPAGRR